MPTPTPTPNTKAEYPTHPNKGFIVAHLNVGSIKNKIEEIQHILNAHSFDVLTLSETWLTPHIETTLVMIEGYEIARADRSRNPAANLTKGGGLLTYTSTRCSANHSKYQHLNICNNNLETQILLVKKQISD